MAAGAIGADVLVVGGGIAGATVAHALAPHAKVVLLERESQPGYHSTGRSAAQYIATYGTPQVRTLTLGSRAFFDHPPDGFAQTPLLRQRSTLTIGLLGQELLLDEAWQVLSAITSTGERLSPEHTVAMVPVLRREHLVGAVHEPESDDIDVHALLRGFLRGLKRLGGSVVCDAEVLALKHEHGRWQAHTRQGVFEAPVLVNAAGAWADVLATMAGVRPIGLVPKRRSAFTFAAPAGLEVSRWPLVVSADHSFYFKPDAGALFGSPANEDPTVPQDVQPEELDIATGAHLIEQHTTMTVRPQRTWAGLRSFVADGDLVGGFDDLAPGFFWLAAQGGYGIQTAPAMGEACAALILGQPLPAHLQARGLTAAMLSPVRLRALGG